MKSPRGTCGDCGRVFVLRRDGDHWENRLHAGSDGSACPGVGKTPILISGDEEREAGAKLGECGGRRGESAEMRARAVAAYRKGWSSVAVADRYGTTSSTVLAWVRQAGEEVRPASARPYSRKAAKKPERPQLPAAIKAKAVQAYLDGVSSTEVADRYATNPTTVLNWVRQAGGQVRTSRGLRVNWERRGEKRLAPATAERLTAAAKAAGISHSEFIRRAIEAALDRAEDDPSEDVLNRCSATNGAPGGDGPM